MNNQNHSLYFIAKCFAAYYGSAITKDNVNTGISGNIIDSVLKFGTDGWKIKLRRPAKIDPEHAKRVLEIRKGEDLEDCLIHISDIPTEGYVIMTATNGGHILASGYLYYNNHKPTDMRELQYLIGEGYDMGYSYVASLIDAGIAIEADTSDKFWNKGRKERTIKEEVIANLQYCSTLAVATNSAPHIGLINFVITAFELGKAETVFREIAPVVKNLIEESNKGFQSANN